MIEKFWKFIYTYRIFVIMALCILYMLAFFISADAHVFDLEPSLGFEMYKEEKKEEANSNTQEDEKGNESVNMDKMA